MMLRHVIVWGVLCFTSCAWGAFTRVQTVAPTIPIFLTRGVEEWHASAITGWWTMNETFSPPWEMTTAAGADNIRGTEYDRVNNRMVLFRGDTGEVRFHAMDGSLLSTLNTGLGSGNELSVNPHDGSIWLAYFGGQVRHYSSTGTFLSQFDAGMQLSGIALDPVQETLFLLRADGPGGANGSFDDELWEFSTTGTNLGRLWSSSEIKGNGVGLEYIPLLGRLYVTAQFNASLPNEPYFGVSVYEDLARIPEPGTWGLGVVGMVFWWGLKRSRACSMAS